MAYGNWGGGVYLDGELLPDNCDTTLKRIMLGESTYRIYLEHYLSLPIEALEGDVDTINEMVHAIVGDTKSGVVVLLRKDYVRKIVVVDREGFKEIDLDEKMVKRLRRYDYGDDDFTVKVSGVEISVSMSENRVDVSFTDKYGRRWSGFSGFGIGKGFEY